nr:hypothetical protein [Tanacetum cinerariifolium]
MKATSRSESQNCPTENKLCPSPSTNTQKFINEIGELRAISGHVLGAARVQIPENNLDNLHSTVEEDGTFKTVDAQDLLGLCALLSRGMGLLWGTIVVVVILVKGHAFPTIVKVLPVGCDPLALVGKFTPVEDNIGLLETTFDEDVVLMGLFPDEVTGSVNLTFLVLFIRVTAISLSLKSLMQGHVCFRIIIVPILHHSEKAFKATQRDLAFILLGTTWCLLNPIFLGLPEGCDPLALVGKFTPVEDNIGLLETTFDEDVVLMGLFPDEVTGSVNLTFLVLFIRVTAISLPPKSLMQGHVCFRIIIVPILHHSEKAFKATQRDLVGSGGGVGCVVVVPAVECGSVGGGVGCGSPEVAGKVAARDGECHSRSDRSGSNPSTNIQSTSVPSTHTNANAEENNNDQAEEGEHVKDDEFTNPFCTPVQEVAETSSHNIGNSNVSTFNQPQVSEYRWTKDHPLEQVRGNPSRPIQTRRQLATDPEMCMYALTVSTVEPKNIKKAMADSAWIEAMQEELHQFDRLQGEYMWNYFYQRTLNVGPKHVEMHMKLKNQSGKKMAKYNLNGFVWTLKIWILEIYPNNMFWWTKEPDIIPRDLAWSKFKKASIPILELTPTNKKLKVPWLIRSFLFIRGENVPFIQAVIPGQNVDETHIVNEESVEIDDKSGGIDVHGPVSAIESHPLLDDVDSPFKKVIDVRLNLVGRVNEKRTKLVQTLTSNVIPKEIEVGNTSRPLPFDDSRKPNDYKNNAEMEDNMEVDNEDGKYCLDDMLIGFE